MRRIWEIDDHYFCPIAGFCLSPVERHQVIKKNGGLSVKGPFRRIVVHCYIINSLSIESDFSKSVEKLLNRKHSKMINACRQIKPEDWVDTIDQYLNPDDFGGYIWISAVYMGLSEEQNKYIAEMIHNYGHDILFELQDLAAERENSRWQWISLTEKYKNVLSSQKEKEKLISEKEVENYRLKCRCRNLENELNKVPSDGTGRDAADNQTEIFQKIINTQRDAIERLKAENKTLVRENNEDRLYFKEMKNDVETLLSFLELHNERCKECGTAGLCSRRILIVGGLTRMKSFYRDLIRKMGGEFRYHNGDCHSNPAGLSDLIDQSDIVICPLDVNSHAACLQVKKTCKKTGKEYFMLRNSSLSTIYRTLAGVSGTSERC